MKCNLGRWSDVQAVKTRPEAEEDIVLSTSYGIVGQQAPDWGVHQWFNLPEGKYTLGRADYAGHVVYLYCFQSWCPGCHSSGFPGLLAAQEMFRGSDDVAFVAVQTVFEGFEVNTADKAQQMAHRYGLVIPVGHDPGPGNSGSVLMRSYRTGGTPWTVIIGKKGDVYFNDFHAPPGPTCQLIDLLRQEGER